MALRSADIKRALDRLSRGCSGVENEPGSGYVYILRWRWRGRIKIGRTEGHPADRLLDIQACSPVSLDLVALGHWSLVEGRMHERFAGVRVRHEWFDVPRESLASYLAQWGPLCFGCGEKSELAASVPGGAIDLGTPRARWKPHDPRPPKPRPRYKRYRERAAYIERVVAECGGWTDEAYERLGVVRGNGRRRS